MGDMILVCLVLSLIQTGIAVAEVQGLDAGPQLLASTDVRDVHSSFA